MSCSGSQHPQPRADDEDEVDVLLLLDDCDWLDCSDWDESDWLLVEEVDEDGDDGDCSD
jgi:hypothetical protein